MNPEACVQRQLDACNAKDLQRFVAQYADDCKLYRPPSPEPFLSGRAALAAFYAAQRFNVPTLHAALIGRLVVGNKVIDHERVTGLGDEPIEAALVFEVVGDHIQNVWFYGA